MKHKKVLAEMKSMLQSYGGFNQDDILEEGEIDGQAYIKFKVGSVLLYGDKHESNPLWCQFSLLLDALLERLGINVGMG